MTALEKLKDLPGVPESLKDGMVPDTLRLVYSGHSNGGQGAWWFLSHYPDFAIAGDQKIID